MALLVINIKYTYMNKLECYVVPLRFRMNEIPCEEVNEASSERSVNVLKKLALTTPLKGLMMPRLGTFVMLSEYVSEVTHKWDIGLPISPNQFRCQVFRYILLWF